MNKTAKRTSTLATFLLLAAALPAAALESDRQQPINIDADQGSLDQKNQVTIFSGNVIVTQGSINLHADKVRLSKDAQGNQIINAEGRPVRFGQQLEEKGYVEGEGSRVEYSSATNVVKILGNAQVKRGGDLAKGEAISYNTRTEVYTVLGGKAAGAKSGKRVNVVIQPDTVNKK